NSPTGEVAEGHIKRVKGVAPIKADDAKVETKDAVVDDDAAEAADDRYHKGDARDAR
nr:hypothetical protein [Tanacetum cinerariifolium]